MAVIRVFAKAYVGDQKEPRAGVLQLAKGALDDPIFGVRIRAFRVFVLRNAKKKHGENPEGGGFPRLLGNAVHGDLEHTGAWKPPDCARCVRASRTTGRSGPLVKAWSPEPSREASPGSGAFVAAEHPAGRACLSSFCP